MEIRLKIQEFSVKSLSRKNSWNFHGKNEIYVYVSKTYREQSGKQVEFDEVW